MPHSAPLTGLPEAPSLKRHWFSPSSAVRSWTEAEPPHSPWPPISLPRASCFPGKGRGTYKPFSWVVPAKLPEDSNKLCAQTSPGPASAWHTVGPLQLLAGRQGVNSASAASGPEGPTPQGTGRGERALLARKGARGQPVCLHLRANREVYKTVLHEENFTNLGFEIIFKREHGGGSGNILLQ